MSFNTNKLVQSDDVRAVMEPAAKSGLLPIANRLVRYYNTFLKDSIRIFLRDRLAVAGLIVIFGFVLVAIFAPWIAPYDEFVKNLLPDGRLARLQPPSSQFYFGTTDLGRDIFSQIVMGSRIALMVGLVASAIITVIGTIVGLISGYYGGWVDNLLMRIVDILYSIPFIPFVIVTVSLVRPNIWNIMFAVTLLAWRSVARIIRAQVLSIVQRPYIKAARVAGAGDLRIMFIHIAPNVLPLAFLEMAFMIGWAIITEASISFIGFGDPSMISWGQTLNDCFLSGAIRVAWWWIIPPGMSIVIVVSSVFLITRGLEDVNNPRLRRR